MNLANLYLQLNNFDKIYDCAFIICWCISDIPAEDPAKKMYCRLRSFSRGIRYSPISSKFRTFARFIIYSWWPSYSYFFTASHPILWNRERKFAKWRNITPFPLSRNHRFCYFMEKLCVCVCVIYCFVKYIYI